MHLKKKWIISVILIIIMLVLIIALNIYNSKTIFKMTGESWSNGYYCWGYIITSDGVIKEYDNREKNKNTNSAKISKAELEKLKELINTIKDSYIKNNNAFESRGRGSRKYEIYSPKFFKKIILLDEDDNKIIRNATETSQQIIQLTNNLYEKYLKENL